MKRTCLSKPARHISLFLCLLLLVVFTAGGCSPAQSAQTSQPEASAAGEAASSSPSGEEPAYGGVMVIAMDSEPKTLDTMMTTATLTWTLSWHMFENLFTLDAQQEIIPMLAEGVEISGDGTAYTILLRRGVKFHNGDEMKAEDVIASLNRWGIVASAGKKIYAKLDSIEAADDYTVKIILSEADATFMVSIGAPNNGAIIIPKEIAEAAGENPLTEFIGTGPYRFAEWKPNAYILLERFDDYCALEGEADGYGGRKTAYVDQLKFVPVPDSTVQVAGVESGDYQYAYTALSDDYERLKTTPGIQTKVSVPRAMLMFILNTKEGPMADLKTRQAFQAALSMEDIAMVSRGDPAFWRLNPSLMQKETNWYSELGMELYNQGSIETAKQLLAESGYKGETIRWIAGYESYYNAALVAKSQLEEIGFVIDLQKYESGTESTMRKDPAQWDISVTGYTNRPDPTLVSFMNKENPGWWKNEEKEELLTRMLVELDPVKRLESWERIQELFYQDVPYVKVCDYATLRIMGDNVMNFPDSEEIYFWNVWLKD